MRRERTAEGGYIHANHEADVIQAVPAGVFSPHFELRQPHGVVGELIVERDRVRAELRAQDQRYPMYSEGSKPQRYVLESGGEKIARAVQPSVFFNRLEMEFDGRTFEVRPTHWGSVHYHVRVAGRKIGGVQRTGSVRYGATLDLPAHWPLPAQAFVFWMALMAWKRHDAATAG